MVRLPLGRHDSVDVNKRVSTGCDALTESNAGGLAPGAVVRYAIVYRKGISQSPRRGVAAPDPPEFSNWQEDLTIPGSFGLDRRAHYCMIENVRSGFARVAAAPGSWGE
jgi:hypothetical protein